MPTSTAKKISVDQALELAAISFQVSTLVTSRIAIPKNAAAVASTPRLEPPIHRISSTIKVPSIIHSGRVIGPMLLSSSLACAGASGVFLMVGGYIFDITHGSTMRAARPGTIAANAHVPQSRCTPLSCANFTASGLPAMAVRNIAEVIVLTWASVMSRKEPSFRRDSVLSLVEPFTSARDLMMG